MSAGSERTSFPRVLSLLACLSPGLCASAHGGERPAQTVRVLLLDFAASEPGDSMTRALLQDIVAHELARQESIELVGRAEVRSILGEAAPGFVGCGEDLCLPAVGRLTRAAFVLRGSERRTQDGHALRLETYGGDDGSRLRVDHMRFPQDEDMRPRAREAVEGIAAAVTGRGGLGEYALRDMPRKRRDVKDPVKAALWSLIPGGALFYAGEPKWGAFYGLVGSAGLALYLHYFISGPVVRAWPYGALTLTSQVAGLYHGLHAVSQYNRTRALTLAPRPDGGAALVWSQRF